MKNFLIAVILLSFNIHAQTPVNSEFNYQGELKFNNGLANGTFDFRFVAYNQESDGSGSELAESIVEDVTVDNGLFTTLIEFSNPVFFDNKIWMEINVRPGVETGNYQKMLPRQQIVSAPFAIQTQFVAADSITGIEIANGTIANVHLANDSITSNKIVTNAVGTSELANNSVTSSKIAANAVGASEIATGSVHSSEIAANAVGSSEIINSQVQVRINSSCDEGYYLRGINEDGSVVCNFLALGLSFNIASVGIFGDVTDIVIRPTTGLPIISYRDVTTSTLNIYDCSNIRCSQGVVRILDTNGFVGRYISMAIVEATGFPIISYFDSSNFDLKVYLCSNSNCTSGTARVLDSTGDVGRFSSIGFGNTGLPIISYYDLTNGTLKVHACFNNSCTSGNNFTLDSNGDVGRYTSIVLRPTIGFPIISYHDFTNKNLKVFDCSNSFCSAGTVRIMDNSTSVGTYSSIAINTDEEPIISYFSRTSFNLKFIKCNSDCSIGTPIILDSVGIVGEYSSITVNPDSNLPIISYYDSLNKALKIYSCESTNCVLGQSQTVDNTGDVGVFTSVTIGADGNPIMSYIDQGNQNLKVYHCSDNTCRR